jgi:ribonuclease E
MPKQIIIAEQHHIAAVFWEDQIQELVVATGNQQVGDIYLGIVENVLPGIDAAFVNIGDAERNGFIHVSDLGPLRLKKSAGAITELLAPQQKVLVQVMKEPTGNKGPRLTGNVSLPGRYLVLIPYGRGVNLSRRIKSEDERSRLRALAVLVKPAGMGLLVRTEAEGQKEEAIMEDLEFLQKQWEAVQIQANSLRPPSLLNRDDDFIQRVLRDMYSADVNRIVVDSTHGVKRVKQQLLNWSGAKALEGVFIDAHRERQPILDYFRVNAAIREALRPRVELPSGGYLIIQPTEALTVVDVNSGSFTRSATARETVLWTNSEAATEIARQLRLRNIGGVIIVDFIDMDSRRDQMKLLEQFNKCLRGDKARPQIAQLSELGLVELTRKRQGKNIYELFGKPCPSCGGLGYLAHLPGEGELQCLESSVSIPPPPSMATPSRFVESSFDEEKEIIPYTEKAFEPMDEPSTNIDLLHHPSYQEQGGSSNIRRRRRRLGEEIKEESGSRPVPKETELPTPRERDRSISYRSSRREEIPLQKVTVDMTPLEQELYALMGVSPLIRLDQEFKNPRAVMVTINSTTEEERRSLEEKKQEDIQSLPTETTLINDVQGFTEEDLSNGEEYEDDDSFSSTDESDQFVALEDYPSYIEENSIDEDIEDTENDEYSEESEYPEDSEESENQSNSEDSGDENDSAEESRPLIRRRRRRSSAQ